MQPDSIDARLEKVSQRWDLLQHPFYKRWVAGDLTQAELVYYASQYAHVVRAIPRWLEESAQHDRQHAAQLEHHAAEESDHIALWETFAAALGVDRATLRDAAPNTATAALIATCDELAKTGHGSAVVWAIEAQSPAVSAEKLRGLQAYYGIGAKSGGQYFAVHQELDLEHESQLRSVIHSQPEAIQDAAPAAAATTLVGMWDLLTAAQDA